MTITIPLYTMLFIYFAFLAVVFIFGYINVTHIFHSGSLTFVSFAFTFFIGAFTIVNLFYTSSLLFNVDWQQPLTVWNSSWITTALNLTNI